MNQPSKILVHFWTGVKNHQVIAHVHEKCIYFCFRYYLLIKYRLDNQNVELAVVRVDKPFYSYTPSELNTIIAAL